MGTKTIGLREDVYERLAARKREDESFTELVDRLIDESTVDWRETFGSLPAEDAEELADVAERSRERTGGGRADRQRASIEAFAEASEEDEDRSDGD
jgi:predicted CopG family antitoxin